MILSGTILAGCGGSKSTGSQSATDQATPTAKTESISDILAKGQKIDGLAYDYNITAGGMTVSGKTWMMGKMMKTESTVGGENIFTYVDSTANTVTIYNVNQKTATKMTAVQAENQNTVSETPLDYNSGIDQATVKELETVVYDGVKCRVVEVTDKDSKSVTKMWIREDHGIPMRIESTDPTGGKFVMEYKNMKIGSLSADVFQLPSGINITDMSEMMKQMQQKLPNIMGGQQ
jgi:outer membrane lipoprotein-sorting protein